MERPKAVSQALAEFFGAALARPNQSLLTVAGAGPRPVPATLERDSRSQSE